jgi:integrase/recombinase XerC
MENKPYKKKFRKFLNENEIAKVLDVCCHTKYPDRNQSLIFITYNHALRAGQVCNLQWKHIDFDNNQINIISQKGGIDTTHPIFDNEKESLLKLYENRNKNLPYVFTSERNAKFEPQNFYRLTLKLGKMAGFDFVFTPHMLRHGRATFLANKDIHILKIKAFLGHKRLSSTELYTHLASNQFNNINDGSIFG